MAPSQPREVRAAGGGTISASGLPKRVTTTGWPVLATSASTARHVDLNFETAMLRMEHLIPWSVTMVQLPSPSGAIIPIAVRARTPGPQRALAGAFDGRAGAAVSAAAFWRR